MIRILFILLFPITALSADLDTLVMRISLEHNQASIDANMEYYGVILSDQHGNLTHTVEHSDGEIVSFTIRRKVAQSIVAIWHTHGAKGKDKEYFSNYDTSTSKYYNVPVYMMDSNWRLRVFKPEDKTFSTSKARRMGLIRGMAKGNIVNRAIAGI